MKKEWLKIEIPNLQFKPWIDSLLSTCDNKPPARTFSHNYVVCTTESKSGPQLLSFFFAFCWLNVTRCDIIHSVTSRYCRCMILTSTIAMYSAKHRKKSRKKTLLPKRTADIIVIIDTNANFHSVSQSLSLNSYS